MSGSETGKGLSLWPKLVLWGAVIAVGVLYLGSVSDRPDGEDPGRQSAGPARQATPVEAAPPEESADAQDATSGAAPREDLVSSQAPVSMPVAVSASPAEAADAGEPTPRAAAGTVGAAGVAVTEQGSVSRTGEQGVAPVPGAAARPPAAAARSPAAEVTRSTAEDVAAPGPAVEPVTAGQPAEVSPAEAEAFAKAVISGTPDGESGQAMAPTSVDPASVAAPEEAAPAREVADAPAEPAQESLADRRARVMAEYEAMRQRAQEEMRRRWRQGPPPSPYGAHPGYPPAYYPQRQP